MRDALADARRAGLRIEVGPLGDGSRFTVLSEYDRAARTIRVNAAVLERVRAAHGDGAAASLLVAAVAHELYHHAVAKRRLVWPRRRARSERNAERFARLRYGVEPALLERILLR